MTQFNEFTIFSDMADYTAYFESLMTEEDKAAGCEPAPPPVEFPFAGRQVMDDLGNPVEFLVISTKDAAMLAYLLNQLEKKRVA